MKNTYEIQGYRFFKLKYLTNKSIRIKYLKEHLVFLSETYLNSFDYSKSLLIQLQNKFNAVDASISTYFWLIEDFDSVENKIWGLEKIMELILYSKQNFIEFPSQHWFDNLDNKVLLKKEFSKDIFSAMTSGIEIQILLIENQKFYDSFLIKKNEMITEIKTHKTLKNLK